MIHYTYQWWPCIPSRPPKGQYERWMWYHHYPTTAGIQRVHKSHKPRPATDSYLWHSSQSSWLLQLLHMKRSKPNFIANRLVGLMQVIVRQLFQGLYKHLCVYLPVAVIKCLKAVSSIPPIAHTMNCGFSMLKLRSQTSSGQRKRQRGSDSFRRFCDTYIS